MASSEREREFTSAKNDLDVAKHTLVLVLYPMPCFLVGLLDSTPEIIE